MTYCVSHIKELRMMWRQVPTMIGVKEALELVGCDELDEIMEEGNPETTACGKGRQRIN
jgi:hypothetical protein